MEATDSPRLFLKTHRNRWEAHWEQDGFQVGVSIRRKSADLVYRVSVVVTDAAGLGLTQAAYIANHTSARAWGRKIATQLIDFCLKEHRG